MLDVNSNGPFLVCPDGNRPQKTVFFFYLFTFRFETLVVVIFHENIRNETECTGI